MSIKPTEQSRGLEWGGARRQLFIVEKTACSGKCIFSSNDYKRPRKPLPVGESAEDASKYEDSLKAYEKRLEKYTAIQEKGFDLIKAHLSESDWETILEHFEGRTLTCYKIVAWLDTRARNLYPGEAEKILDKAFKGKHFVPGVPFEGQYKGFKQRVHIIRNVLAIEFSAANELGKFISFCSTYPHFLNPILPSYNIANPIADNRSADTLAAIIIELEVSNKYLNPEHREDDDTKENTSPVNAKQASTLSEIGGGGSKPSGDASALKLAQDKLKKLETQIGKEKPFFCQTHRMNTSHTDEFCKRHERNKSTDFKVCLQKSIDQIGFTVA